ncbi:hypothetical protein DI270_000150 [Microbispora triticiradicis]|uniref:Sensor domain-containing protein n=1 Tax=Microbispora triticiradicis TaxID=2200763 RepID=A0ABX9LSM5_9ACTN|nr:hypothetical protein [Microbispora triticiradicis]RGA07017.1 hypothetical protein DI270_000150 [Microbispora triticiradicis]
MRIVHAAVAGLLALATGPSVAAYTTSRATGDSPRTTGALATNGAGARATSDAGATRDARATQDARATRGAGAPATRGTGVRATRDAMAARSTGRLRGVLGTMRDLPEGFFSHARAPWRAPFRPRASACRALFDAAAGRPPRDGLGGAAAVTAATYDGPHLGELAGVGLAVYDGNEAAQHLDVLRAALIRCATADAGTPYDRLKASPVPLPGIGGPDAAARGLTGRAGGYPYRMHLVVARSGHTLITLVHAGLTPPDPARTAELARLLVREVGTLDG